ncbi:ATP-binding protein [Actinomadura rubrisoli]|uniref:ATP-binding protein n=1 Tax=Actinomadura rubrisoli TaxID=2530368 RepID=A0A4R5A5D9_9ACTN|nr:ATP-binding protein [Actinomadura rubrisoli]TDD66785.1 ATP-binding protein [Actinomadura rubrisoli]
MVTVTGGTCFGLMGISQDAANVGRVRAWIIERLEEKIAFPLFMATETRNDIVSCASEIVANSVVHAAHGTRGDAVKIRLILLRYRIRVEVTDPGPRNQGGALHADTPNSDAETGRGLFIVDALSADWGDRLDGDGRMTWFELER